MFCKNCGAELTGTENICPQCGAPVSNEQPVMITPDAQMNQNPPINEQSMVEQQNPVGMVPPDPPVMTSPSAITPQEPISGIQQQPQMNQTTPMPGTPQNGMVPQIQQPAPAQEGKKLSLTTIILIAILVAIILIGIILAIIMGRNKNTPTTTTTQTGTTTPTTDPVVTTTTNTITYGGYSFTIPDGYETEETSDLGLVVANEDTAYTILIDYYQSYSTYKSALMVKYPELGTELERTISGRKYLLISYIKEDGKYAGTAYVSSLIDTASFVGATLKRDGSEPIQNDFITLTKILNSAKTSVDSTFVASDSKKIENLVEPSPADIKFKDK